MRGASQTQGAPVLNCPGCGTKVADGTAICPSCDYIIDASFISTDAPQDPDDGAEAGPPPPRRQTSSSRAVRTAPGTRGGTGSRPAVRSGTGSRPRVPTSTSARPAAPVASNEDATNIKSMDEILRNAPQRPAGARSSTGSRPAARPGGTGSRAAAPSPRRAPETELDPSDLDDVPTRDVTGPNTGTGQIVAPEQVLEDFRDFVSVLGPADRIAFAGGATLILSAFLPWKETAAEGDILGLMSLGLLAVLAAIGILGAITVRVRRTMPHLNVLVPWLAQLGLSVFCILWCIIFMKLSHDATEVPSPMGNATIMNSSPSFGVFLGLLGAVVSLGGTLLGLKERPTS